MRHIRKRIATSAVGVLALAAGLVVTPATPAQALTVPDLQWSAVELDDSLPLPSHMVSQANGGVTVGCSSYSGTTSAFMSFSNTGSTAQGIPTTDGNLSYFGTCADTSAVGPDGAVYTAAYDTAQNKEVLAKYSGDSLQWKYTLPCSTFGKLAVGANGNIYMVAWSGACSNPRLIGVEPTLDTGETVPDVVANTQLPREVLNGGLSPYSSGIVLRYYDGFGFYDYSGTLQDETLYAQLGAFDGQPFTATNGWAVIPVKDTSPPVMCQGDNNIVEFVNAYGVSGLIWSHTLPACSHVLSVRPMYNGGAVAFIEVMDDVTFQFEKMLYAIPPTTGQQHMWAVDVPASDGDDTYNGFAYAVDLNGNIAVQRTFTRYDGGYNYPGVRLVLLSGFTGMSIWSDEFYGNASDGHGFCMPGGNSAVTITNGTWYVNLAEGNPYGGCNYGTTKLYAVDVPTLTMDYPRGAVLNDDEPWLDYVAMGDSYSSGEGVPGFDAATDTAGPPVNRCHRSNYAYGKLLHNNPGLRLQLVDFVACSGAETRHITGTWTAQDAKNTNEAAQVDALSSSTDIVTITIGGNDVGFKDFAVDCVLLTVGCDGAAYTEIMGKIQNNLPDALNDAFEAIEDEIGTQTKVYVMGYPMLIPPASVNTFANCPYFTGDEKTAARTVATELNAAVLDAVNAVNNVQQFHHFVYVDPNGSNSPFVGHEVCLDSGSYFNGATVTPMEYSFHPNAKGQAAYWELMVTNF